jgi:hypothetical protein
MGGDPREKRREGLDSMLRTLQMRDVGPAPRFDVEFSDRLNVFTGDNGLGKSFILDIAWWALTGTWAGSPAVPKRGGGAEPEIAYCLKTRPGTRKRLNVSKFDFPGWEWPRPKGGPVAPSLVVYAQVDGGYSVWDPARLYREPDEAAGRRQPRAIRFTAKQVWDGLPENGQTLCNGLIRDWVQWQMQYDIERIKGSTRTGKDGDRQKASPFGTLERLIEQLVAIPGEPIRIGAPGRVSPLDAKDIPTLSMPYGDVPVLNVSAGIKRIVGLAYLLTWAWYEHKRASELRNQKPVENLVILIDEVESHLHPRWQRTMLPSILDVGKTLEAEVDCQFIVTTHSPLVLASLEPFFVEERDTLFWFDLKDNGVVFRALPWAKYGDVDGWLTSPVFNLQQARSKEAEEAIGAAKAFIKNDRSALPPGLKTRAQIDKRLRELLGGQDPFLIRWALSTEAPGK